MAAIDFTTIEVWKTRGLATFYLLFVIELATRRMHFAGCTCNPDCHWMKQTAGNLEAFDGGILDCEKHILMDRGTKCTPEFRKIAEDERAATIQFVGHDHRERNHQSLGNETIDAGPEAGQGSVCDERLGGLLNYYHRRAA